MNNLIINNNNNIQPIESNGVEDDKENDEDNDKDISKNAPAASRVYFATLLNLKGGKEEANLLNKLCNICNILRDKSETLSYSIYKHSKRHVLKSKRLIDGKKVVENSNNPFSEAALLKNSRLAMPLGNLAVQGYCTETKSFREDNIVYDGCFVIELDLKKKSNIIFVDKDYYDNEQKIIDASKDLENNSSLMSQYEQDCGRFFYDSSSIGNDIRPVSNVVLFQEIVEIIKFTKQEVAKEEVVCIDPLLRSALKDTEIFISDEKLFDVAFLTNVTLKGLKIVMFPMGLNRRHHYHTNLNDKSAVGLLSGYTLALDMLKRSFPNIKERISKFISKRIKYFKIDTKGTRNLMLPGHSKPDSLPYFMVQNSTASTLTITNTKIVTSLGTVSVKDCNVWSKWITSLFTKVENTWSFEVLKRRKTMLALDEDWKRKLLLKLGDDIPFRNADRIIDQDIFISALAYIYLIDNPTMIIKNKESEKNPNSTKKKEPKMMTTTEPPPPTPTTTLVRSHKSLRMFNLIKEKEVVIKSFVSYLVACQSMDVIEDGLLWKENELYTIGLKLYTAETTLKKRIVVSLHEKFKKVWDSILSKDKDLKATVNIEDYREFCVVSVLYEWLYRRKHLFSNNSIPEYKDINDYLKYQLPSKSIEKEWEDESKIIKSANNEQVTVDHENGNVDKEKKDSNLSESNILYPDCTLNDILKNKSDDIFSNNVDKGDCTLAWIITLLAERFCSLFNVVNYPSEFYEEAIRDEERGGLGLEYRGLSKDNFIHDCSIIKDTIKGYIGLITSHNNDTIKSIYNDNNKKKNMNGNDSNLDRFYLPPHTSVTDVGHGGKIACRGCVEKTERVVSDIIREYNQRVLDLKVRAFNFNDNIKEHVDISNNTIIKKIILGSGTYSKVKKLFYNNKSNEDIVNLYTGDDCNIIVNNNNSNDNNNDVNHNNGNVDDIDNDNDDDDDDDDDTDDDDEDDDDENDDDEEEEEEEYKDENDTDNDEDNEDEEEEYKKDDDDNNNNDDNDDDDEEMMANQNDYNNDDKDIDNDEEEINVNNEISKLKHNKKKKNDGKYDLMSEGSLGAFDSCQMEEFYSLRQAVFSPDVKSAICHRQRFISLEIVKTVNRLLKTTILRDRKKLQRVDKHQLKYINSSYRVFKKYVVPFSFPLNMTSMINRNCKCNKSKRKPLLVIPNSHFTQSIVTGMRYNTLYRERAVFHDIAVLLGFTGKHHHKDKLQSSQKSVQDKGLFLISSLLHDTSLYQCLMEDIKLGQLSNPRILNRLEFDKGNHYHTMINYNNTHESWHRLMIDPNREGERTLFNALFLLVSNSSPSSVENMTLTTVLNQEKGLSSRLVVSPQKNLYIEGKKEILDAVRQCRLLDAIKDLISYYNNPNSQKGVHRHSACLATVLEHVQFLFKNSLPINLDHVHWETEVFDMKREIFNLDEGGVILALSKFLKGVLELFFGNNLLRCSGMDYLELLFKEAEDQMNEKKKLFPTWMSQLLLVYEKYLDGNDISILERFVNASSLLTNNNVMDTLNIVSSFSPKSKDNMSYEERARWIVDKETGNSSVTFTYIVLVVACYRLFFEAGATVRTIFSKHKNDHFDAFTVGALVESIGLCGNIWTMNRKVDYTRVRDIYMRTHYFPLDDNGTNDEIYYYRFMAFVLGFYLLSEERLATISHDIHLKYDFNDFSTNRWNVFIKQYFNMFLLGRRGRLLCAPLRYFKRLLSQALSSTNVIMKRLALLLFMKRVNGEEISSANLVACCGILMRPASLKHYYTTMKRLGNNIPCNDYEYSFYGNACSTERYDKVLESKKLVDTCISMMEKNKKVDLMNNDYHHEDNGYHETNKSGRKGNKDVNHDRKKYKGRPKKQYQQQQQQQQHHHHHQQSKHYYYPKGGVDNDSKPKVNLSSIIDDFKDHMNTVQVIDNIKDVIGRLKLFFEVENPFQNDDIDYNTNIDSMFSREDKEKIKRAIVLWNDNVQVAAKHIIKEYTLENFQHPIFTSCDMSIIKPDDFQNSGKDIINVYDQLILYDNNTIKDEEEENKVRKRVAKRKYKDDQPGNKPFETRTGDYHNNNNKGIDDGASGNDNNNDNKKKRKQSIDHPSSTNKRQRLNDPTPQDRGGNTRQDSEMYNMNDNDIYDNDMGDIEAQQFAGSRVLKTFLIVNQRNMYTEKRNCKIMLNNTSVAPSNNIERLNYYYPAGTVTGDDDDNQVHIRAPLYLPSKCEEKYSFVINRQSLACDDEIYTPLECFYKCFEGIHPVDQIYLFKKLLMRPYNKLWVMVNKELVRRINIWGYLGIDNLNKPYCILAEQKDTDIWSNMKDEESICAISTKKNEDNMSEGNKDNNNSSSSSFNNISSSFLPLAENYSYHQLPGILHSKYLSPKELNDLYMVNNYHHQQQQQQYSLNQGNNQLLNYICKKEVFSTIHSMLTNNRYQTSRNVQENVSLTNNFSLFYIPHMDIFVDDHISKIQVKLREDCRVEKNSTVFFDDMETSMIDGLKMWSTLFTRAPYTIRIAPWHVRQKRRRPIRCYMDNRSYSDNVFSTFPIFEDAFHKVNNEDGTKLGCSMLLSISHAMQISLPVKSKFVSNANSVCNVSKTPKWLKCLASNPPLPRHILSDTSTQDFGILGTMYINMGVNIGHLLVDYDCTPRRSGTASAMTENIFYVAKGICTRASALSWESVKTVVRKNKKFLFTKGDDTFKHYNKKLKKHAALFHVSYWVTKHASNLFSDYILYSRFSRHEKDLDLVTLAGGIHPVGWCMFLADPIRYPSRLTLKQNHLQQVVDNAGVATILRTNTPCRKFNRDLALKNGDLLSIKMEKSNNSCIAMEKSLYFLINGRMLLGGQIDGMSIEMDTMVKNKITVEKHLVYSLCISSSLVGDILSVALEGSAAVRGLAVLEYTQRLWDAGKKDIQEKEFWSNSFIENGSVNDEQRGNNGDGGNNNNNNNNNNISNNNNDDGNGNNSSVGDGNNVSKEDAKLTPPNISCSDDDYIFLDILYNIANIPLNQFKTDVEMNNQRAVIRCYLALVDQDTGCPVPHLLYIFRMILNFCGFIHIITTMDCVKTHHLLYDAAIIGINMAKKIITILVGSKGNNAKSTLARTFEECLWSMVANVSIKSFNESCGSVSSTQANLAGVLGKKLVAVCDEVGYQGSEKYHTDTNTLLWNQLKEGTRKSNILQCAHLARRLTTKQQQEQAVESTHSRKCERSASLLPSPLPRPLLPPLPRCRRRLRCNRKIFLTDIAWWNKRDNTVLEKLNPRNMIAFCLSQGIIPFSGAYHQWKNKPEKDYSNNDDNDDDNNQCTTKSGKGHTTEYFISNTDAALDYEMSREYKILRLLSSLGLDINQHVCQVIKTILLTPETTVIANILSEYKNYTDVWEQFDRVKMQSMIDIKRKVDEQGNSFNDNDDDDGNMIELYDYHNLFTNDATLDTGVTGHGNTTTTTTTMRHTYMYVGHIVNEKFREKKNDIPLKSINTLLQNDIEKKTKKMMDQMKDSQAALDSVAQELCSIKSFVVSDGKLIISQTNSWSRGVKLLMSILKPNSSMYLHLYETNAFNSCTMNLRNMLELNNYSDSCGILYTMHAFSPYSDKCKRITKNIIHKNKILKAVFKAHNDAIMSLDVNPRKGVEEFIVHLLFDPLHMGLTKISLSNTKAIKLDHNTIELVLNDASKIPLDSGKSLLQILQNRIRMNEQTLIVPINNDNNNNDSNNITMRNIKENVGAKSANNFYNRKGAHGSNNKGVYFNNMITPLVRQIQDYTCSSIIDTARDDYRTSQGDASNKLLSGQFSCNMIKRVVSTMATVHTRDLFESSKEVIATIALFFMSNSYTFQFGLDTAMLKRILFIPCETVLESSNKNVHVANLMKLIKTGLKTIHSGLIQKRQHKWNNDTDSALVYKTDDWTRVLCDALHTDVDESKRMKHTFNPMEVPCRITQHILQYGVYEISDRQKNAGITTAGNTFFTLYYNIILGSFSSSSLEYKTGTNQNPPHISNVKQQHQQPQQQQQQHQQYQQQQQHQQHHQQQQRRHHHFSSLNPKDLKTFSTAIEAARCGSTKRIEKVFKPLLFLLAPFEPIEEEEEEENSRRRRVVSLSIDGPNISIVRRDGSVDSMLCNVYVPNVDRHVFLYTALPASVSVGSVIYKHLNTVWGSSDITHLQYACHHLHICFELVYRADNPAARLIKLVENNREEMIEFMIACSVYKNILETMGILDCFYTKYSNNGDDSYGHNNNDDDDGDVTAANVANTRDLPHCTISQSLVFPIIIVNYDLSTLLTMTNLTTTGLDCNFHCQLVHRVVDNMGLELNPKYLCSDCKK
uniref:Wsv343-like protein n=1 Tax=Penaeus japonicus TaxID=27405 RepID=A0A2Z6BEF2_PENJP|nr:wsv343-like protein [Penaeus japonicus]